MNEHIEKLALDAGLLNYVDNETPRRCFIDGHADLEEVQKFAELIIRECGEIAYKAYWDNPETVRGIHIKEKIKKHFGVK